MAEMSHPPSADSGLNIQLRAIAQEMTECGEAVYVCDTQLHLCSRKRQHEADARAATASIKSTLTTIEEASDKARLQDTFTEENEGNCEEDESDESDRSEKPGVFIGVDGVQYASVAHSVAGISIEDQQGSGGMTGANVNMSTTSSSSTSEASDSYDSFAKIGSLCVLLRQLVDYLSRYAYTLRDLASKLENRHTYSELERLSPEKKLVEMHKELQRLRNGLQRLLEETEHDG